MTRTWSPTPTPPWRATTTRPHVCSIPVQVMIDSCSFKHNTAVFPDGAVGVYDSSKVSNVTPVQQLLVGGNLQLFCTVVSSLLVASSPYVCLHTCHHMQCIIRLALYMAFHMPAFTCHPFPLTIAQ